MSALISFALVLAAGGALYLGVYVAQPFFVRRVCPTCGERRVEPDADAELAESRHDVHVAGYRCRNCNRQWFTANGGGLMTREAHEAAARAPLPTAIARLPEEPPR